jgi:hypothetical protein
VKRIEKIVIEKIVDTCGADAISDLGEYSDTPGPNAIDREARGEKGRNEYRYFNVELSGEETGNPESVEQDYQRAEEYQRGGWWICGVCATATIHTSHDGKVWLRNKISSGGIWGIASDSDASEFDGIGADELDCLAEVLKEFCFTDQEIAEASASVRMVDA